MRHTVLWFLIVILLMAGCATPTAETPGLLAPTNTTTAEPTTPPTPTAEPTPEPSHTPFSEPTETPTATVRTMWVALIGQDGNVRLVDRISGETQDVTNDATALSDKAGEISIAYWSPTWSSDGQLLAYLRDVGKPVDWGLEYTFELWVYEPETGTSRQLTTEERVVGIAWAPGAHSLALSFGIDETYFTTRGQVDSSKAKGIWSINVDSGEFTELVQPENGYSLGRQRWANDGRYLFFEEVWNYEGSGYFAYYDFETSTYVASGETIGFSDLSPDGATLAYDTLTYAPRGDEQIFVRPLAGGESKQFSPNFDQGYAFYPRFSPSGDQIAYLADIMAPESGNLTLYVQPAQDGEPLDLGNFENGLYLNWLPDGSGLIFSAGPFEARQVLEVSLADGAIRVLADGDSPALQPSNP
jgi:hypothetical protein